jgi:hypothetical protein
LIQQLGLDGPGQLPDMFKRFGEAEEGRLALTTWHGNDVGLKMT